MAINKESNGYIMGFATVLVIVVGTILAMISMSLKPIQKENVKNEKMQLILKAVNVNVERNESGEEFGNYVKRRIVLSYDGKILSDKTGPIDEKDQEDAFNVDIQKEYKSIRDINLRKYPLFICEKEGKRYYVFPCVGVGLWDAVWGFIGMETDFNNIYGAVFDHKGETPGLGAEISKDFFGEQFKGKQFLNANGKFTSVRVVKPGFPLDEHKVDGITGGTFTSVGVDEMIKRSGKVYYDFLQANPNALN